MLKEKVLFITGIDTDAGKTYATAYLSRMLASQGRQVITQKSIQTGCTGSSEDIEAHRRLCGGEYYPEDTAGLTAPLIFSYPASAQLAAAIDGRTIDMAKIEACTMELGKNYDSILIEGAGGLMVPIHDDYFTIDYIAEHNYPAVLVTNGRLGSINHTILSLDALKKRGIKVAAVVYNRYFDRDKTICADTVGFIKRYMAHHHPQAEFIDMPCYEQW